MLGSYKEVPEVGDALLSSSCVPKGSCLQFCVAFLTPKSSYFQTQAGSNLPALCPHSCARRVLGGFAGQKKLCRAGKTEKNFALECNKKIWP